MSDYEREFGRHVRSLRRARDVTQDQLAKRSGLSADTIRRVEHGSFSASIGTLRKLCMGLGITPSTLFESFELGRVDELHSCSTCLRVATPRSWRASPACFGC